MIIIELKQLNKVKNSPDGLNDRLEIWKNIKDRSIEFIHCEQQRENRWDKMNRASETCGKKTKDITFLSLKSQKERRKYGTEKNIWRNNDWTFPKFGEKHKPIHLRSWVNPQEMNEP